MLAVLLSSILYMAARLRVGWVPNDEGTLASSALRVYLGQLPQRDFAEIYTGGLSFLHAAAFHAFGVNLFSMRLMAMLLFLPMLAAVYWISRRFVGPLASAAVTLTAMAWSFPNNPTGMPSWYNLFFAVYGAAALLRFLQVRRWYWLFLAGVFGGASILIHLTGLYYVAAVLLLLLFVEQDDAKQAGDYAQQANAQQTSRVYQVLCSGGLLLFLAVVVRLVGPPLHLGEAYHFLLPSATCVALLLYREYGLRGASSVQRFGGLVRLVLPFLAGVAIPIAVFLVPYAQSHSVATLVHGLSDGISQRTSAVAGAHENAGLAYLAYGLGYGLLTIAVFVSALYCDVIRASWRRLPWVRGLLLAVILVVSAVRPGLQDTWLMAGMVTPLIVLLGVVQVLRGTDARAGQRMMLFLALAAVCSLVQFPVLDVTYFCYVAPLTLLAGVAIAGERLPNANRHALAALLVFFLGFGIFALNSKHVYNAKLDTKALHRLSLPRAGGLRVDATTSEYEELIPLIQAHAVNGLLYAANDAPEVYFLSGLQDPTRDDAGAPPGDVFAALRSSDLHVVVLNEEPLHAASGVAPEIRATVVAMMPFHQTVGRFTVYWR